MTWRMLSESIPAVISQVLVKCNGGGLVAAHEMMPGTTAICTLIRDDKVPQMFATILAGRKYGMQTLEQSLKELIDRRIITRQSASKVIGSDRI